MKRSAVALIVLVCLSPVLHAQRTRFGPPPPKAAAVADYPLKVHISGIHVRSHCSEFRGPTSCKDVIYADSVIDGAKIELMGDRIWLPAFSEFAVAPGDYQARMKKDAPHASAIPLDREYELVLPHGIVWRCTVTGISE